MIIRRHGKDLLLITQADHAALAADIVSRWTADGFPANPRRDVILLAAREHDNGWLEEDATTLVDAAGEPLDFVAAPVPVKHRIWPRAAERLGKVDPYAGALVAHHAGTVHGQQRSDPVWRGFLDRMARLERELLARCPHQEETGGDGGLRAALVNDYRFVQAGDQLSLIFCNGWTAPFPRPGGRTILKGTTLEVTPDPFGGASVPLRVRARRLTARSFASAADLRAAFDAAPVVMIEGEAAGAGPNLEP
jgi:hypothetical protein